MGDSNAKKDFDLDGLVDKSESNPESVIDDLEHILPFLIGESYQNQKRASEIVLNLSKTTPSELSEYFDAFAQYIREVDGDIQLTLIRTCDEIRGYISEGSLQTHQETFLSLLDDDNYSYELLEAVSGIISDIARINPKAVENHVGQIASLLYSDIPDATNNSLRTLESIAQYNPDLVTPYTDELFETIRYSPLPEENRLALSILSYIIASNPTEINDQRYVEAARKLALSDHEIVSSEAVKEIGLVIAERPEMAGSLLDILVRNLNSHNEQTRRQSMIECLRISNHQPQLFSDIEDIDPKYTSRLVKEVIKEHNYESEVTEAFELANQIGG